ncbi:MAG: site-specific integrase [Bacteroidetes bacterium]|uniref:Site-specific integrase n=1 Tax=Candidatus Cryptobacteroides faecipullorum TaxID=2840764 RepID=A0A9D9I9A3_9BACT|nr:site-specific integrase [Candidatus Cryptobacteroides faecipullorum]
MKRMILDDLNPVKSDADGNFIRYFKMFTESREKEGTKNVYRQTLARMEAFDNGIGHKTFEEINLQWLRDFEKFLSQTARSANARAIHFRNIRALFNYAIDEEVTSFYPFRKFKIKSQPTPKRSLSAEQLRSLINTPVEEYQEKYRDLFVLMFYLCGVNAVDLLNAGPEAVQNGRLEYIRAKTHKAYSVKIEPEAERLIRKYTGKGHLLCIMDTRTNYLDFLRRMDKALKEIGPSERHGLGGKVTRHPMFPKISQYWCRHTWATIAAELDIPKETIAAGLGHGGNSVTDIYIRFDRKKVDEANRRIIDYVLYGKK